MGRHNIKIEDSLLIKNPAVAAEWDYEKNGELKPSNVSACSKKRVFWTCKVCGYSWNTSPNCRVHGTGCPFCSGRKPRLGINDFKTLHPDIAEQWDYEHNGVFKPSDFKEQSNKSVHWKCHVCNQIWKSQINNRTRGSGCPYCAGKKSIWGITDLQTLRPILVEQWDYHKNGELLPSDVTLHSGKKVYWKCEICNQSWLQAVWARVHGYGCPYCTGRKPILGVTDLETVYPEIAKQWDCERNEGLLPQDMMPSSGKKVYWKCEKCHYSWRATLLNRVAGKGCPNCSSRKKSVRRNV